MSATADLILHNGTVLTVDSRSSVADAVAIKQDRIMAVGGYDGLAALRGKHTRLIDLEAGTAIPGMIDNHTHQLLAGIDLVPGGKVNIAECRSIAEIKALIAARVQRLAPGEWLGTSCMFRGALAEKRFPNRLDLDEVAPDNPVYIFQSGKNIIANSRALEIAGIDATTSDPTGPDYSAGHIVRDANQQATGHLIAGAGDLARRRWWQARGQPMQKWDFLHFDQSVYEEAILAQMKVFNAAGITGTRDMGVSVPEMAGYRGLADKGTATVRTELIVGLPIRYVPIDAAQALIETYDGPRQGDGDDLAWVGGFKFVLQNDGYWSHSPEKFRRLIRCANRLGRRLAIHGAAVHDQDGWDRIMEVLEEANAERPLAGRRISLEHFIGTRRPEHLRRLREWGIIIAPNPSLSFFAAGRSYEMHKVMQEVRIAQPSSLTPMEHARREWGLPIRSWIDNGLMVTGGTDCPATTYDPERPLLGMYAARTQQSLAGVLLPEQIVTPEEALRMWTINAAYSLCKEDRVGSIEPGKFADIVVLSGNPLTSSDAGLLDIRIRRTIMGGRVVFDGERAMLTADVVFKNGRIVTCDGEFSIATSLAVRDGRILAVAGEPLDSLASSAARVIDLKGRCVLPGQVDGYSHVMTSGLDLLPSGGKVNITRLQSIETILGAIAARAAETPRGEWIATSCMYRGGLAEGRWPDRHDLDKAAPHHPAYIMQGGRPILANSKALALAGIDENTPDPTDPAGKIVRDAAGKPTGQLIAGAADLARRRWSAALGIPPEEWDFMLCGEKELLAALESQQKVLHACGVTATRDVATMRREVGAFVTARREKRLQLRTQLLIIIPERYMRSEADFAAVFASYFQPWTVGDSLLSIGGVAIDYSLDGWRMMDRALLGRLIADSNRKGWTMAVTPGIGGEQEVDEVLDALEAADRERPIFDRHFPIMHPMGLRRPDQLARARKLGLTLNPNPLLNHFAAERSVRMFEAVAASGLLQSKARSGMEQAASMWGLSAATWIDAGLLVSAGSNTPAAIYDAEHPLLGLYTFQTGDTRVGRLIDGQGVSRRQAIEAYTRNGAAALGFAREYGSLEPGKLADLVVFDTDVLACEDAALPNAKVLTTYFAGEPVYQR